MAWKSLVLAITGILLAHGASRAQDESVLLNDSSGGELTLEGENRLVISDLNGTLSIRLGKSGELRYMARDLETRRAEVPVGLWLEGKALVLAPLDEHAAQRVFVEIAIPPQLDLELATSDSVVSVAGLQSRVEAHGSKLDLQVSGISRSVSAEIDGGSARLEFINADIDVRGTDLAARLANITGEASLAITRGTADIDIVSGPLSLELRDCTVDARGIQGRAQVTAEGGSISLDGVRNGAELILGATPLSMSDVAGGVYVETEANIEFRNLKSNLTVRGYGVSVRGIGNVGGVDVTSDEGEVHLEKIQGAVSVEGQNLTVRVAEIGGETTIHASMSGVSVQNAAAAVSVETDFGDVLLDGIEAAATITSRSGNVTAQGLEGPLTLNADGEQVVVEWARLDGEQSSTIVNESGDVRVGVPPAGRWHVEAEAPYGSIQSGVPAIRVSDDGKSASGSMGGAQKPAITVRAGGEISFLPTQKRAGS